MLRRELLHDFILSIIELVGDLGYLGLFLMMLLESSFVPFPSEIAMIPAGYLAYAGELNFFGAESQAASQVRCSTMRLHVVLGARFYYAMVALLESANKGYNLWKFSLPAMAIFQHLQGDSFLLSGNTSRCPQGQRVCSSPNLSFSPRLARESGL